jgi:hypothetical protein
VVKKQQGGRGNNAGDTANTTRVSHNPLLAASRQISKATAKMQSPAVFSRFTSSCSHTALATLQTVCMLLM